MWLVNKKTLIILERRYDISTGMLTACNHKTALKEIDLKKYE